MPTAVAQELAWTEMASGALLPGGGVGVLEGGVAGMLILYGHPRRRRRRRARLPRDRLLDPAADTAEPSVCGRAIRVALYSKVRADGAPQQPQHREASRRTRAMPAGAGVTHTERDRGLQRALVAARESDPRTGDESALLALAQAGDEDAFENLVRRYSPRLRGVLFRIVREPEAADDAAQDALLRAWQNIDRFQGRSSFFTWLTRIGINEAYRTISRNEAPATLPLDDALGERIPGWGDRPDEVFQSREFLAAIEAALARLPIEYREAVVLRDVEGLSTSETAEILDIRERALKSRLHRGRMALRRELDAYFNPE